MDREAYRNRLIDAAVSAFSKGRMNEAEFEAFASQVQKAGDDAELDAAAAAVAPQVADDGSRAAPVRELSLDRSTLKKHGEWADARVYRLAGRMSNFEFDFLAYRDSPGFSMIFDVDLSMSNLKIIVPEDWRVDIRLSRNAASTVKDRGPSSGGVGRIIVQGSVSMSVIKVKRLREGQSGMLARLFGR